MHRSVGTDDIIQFATNSQDSNHIAVQKTEDVEYYKRRLHSSSGTTTVSATGPVEQQTFHDHYYGEIDGFGKVFSRRRPHEINEDEFGTAEFGGKGHYSLKLQYCAQNSTKTKEIIDSETQYRNDIILAQMNGM